MTYQTAVVDLINVIEGWVALDDGSSLPIVRYWDEWGGDCDPEEAAVIIAGRTDYGWLAIKIEDERPVIQ